MNFKENLYWRVPYKFLISMTFGIDT